MYQVKIIAPSTIQCQQFSYIPIGKGAHDIIVVEQWTMKIKSLPLT